MKKSTFSGEQNCGNLREVDKGAKVAETFRKHRISDAELPTSPLLATSPRF